MKRSQSIGLIALAISLLVPQHIWPSRLVAGPVEGDSSRVGHVLTRDEIPEAYTWDVSALFPSDSTWEEDFHRAEESLDEFAGYRGRLGDSPRVLLRCLSLRDSLGIRIDRLSSYAARRHDVDLTNPAYQAMSQKIQGLQRKRSRATAFIEPEILAIGDRKLSSFMKQDEELRLYGHYLDNIHRLRPHILSREEEELLSLARGVTMGPDLAFGMLVNADFTWGDIRNERGNEVEMSRSRYLLFMHSPDRRVRRDAYLALYIPFENHLNTLTSLLITQLKSDIFYSRARRYDSSLDAALDGPNIPTEVYRNLIATVNNNLAPLHRWAGMKKRILGVKALHPYDTYAPLFPGVERRFTYEEAQSIVREALAPLGDEVRQIVDRAFGERWIDVYENTGKEGGAYSSGTYGVHPYILMNFNGTLESVFTLAHELGHTIHSYLSNRNQPYIYSDYATFNAEVASTTNEALLTDYLLEHARSDDERLSLLQHYIQDIGSTFYRQARFAEFELRMHEKVEKDEPLTRDIISGIFGDIYQKYWGPDMAVDDEEKVSWCRIPHFYYDYYVYTYATSFAASQLIARRIVKEGRPAVEDYLKFLSSGSSDYPIELLKIAGVDMTTPAPIEATAARMDELLDQMESIISRRP